MKNPRPRYRLTPAERRLVRLLAAHADCDERTAAKAVRQGVESICHNTVRERVERAYVLIALPAT
jgi:hypothetical protein